MSPRKLSDEVPGTQHVKLEELAGSTILIYRVEKAESLEYGAGVRFEFQLWDPKKGQVQGPMLDAMSFGPGVRRKLEALPGLNLGGIWSDPEGLLAEVGLVGKSLQLT